MNKSKYQQDILDAVTNTKNNILVEAVAGSGKTTTLQLIGEVIPRGKSVCVVCFNKAIANEFGDKFPPRFDCSTMHSLGFKILRGEGRVTSSDKKMANILRYTIMGYSKEKGWNGIPEEEKQYYYDHHYAIERVWGLAKARCITNPSELGRCYEELAGEFGIDLPQRCSITREIIVLGYQLSLDKTKRVDFDDMILYPATDSELPFPKYDYVLVDEAQDLNKVQRTFIHRMMEGGGRLIAVGDRRQSIYGFRGADSASMDCIRDEFGCVELPLSICYRCDHSIIEKAREFVPQIESREGAGEGLFMTIGKHTFLEQVCTGDLVLCRMNAPLVELCMDLLEMGFMARIQGRDMSDRLVKRSVAVDKKRHSFDEESIRLYEITETERLTKKEKFYAIKNMREECEVLGIMSKRCSNLSELKAMVYKLYRPERGEKAIILSTIHKVKGMENERVFVYAIDLLPCPWANGWRQLEQEKNLEYVAITRAKKELYYVETN